MPTPVTVHAPRDLFMIRADGSGHLYRAGDRIDPAHLLGAAMVDAVRDDSGAFSPDPDTVSAFISEDATAADVKAAKKLADTVRRALHA